MNNIKNVIVGLLALVAVNVASAQVAQAPAAAPSAPAVSAPAAAVPAPAVIAAPAQGTAPTQAEINAILAKLTPAEAAIIRAAIGGGRGGRGPGGGRGPAPKAGE